MSGCETCGYVGGLDMMECGRHCKPCHIYCRCPQSFDQVMEKRAALGDIDGYAWTLYDYNPRGRVWPVPAGKELPYHPKAPVAPSESNQP